MKILIYWNFLAVNQIARLWLIISFCQKQRLAVLYWVKCDIFSLSMFVFYIIGVFIFSLFGLGWIVKEDSLWRLLQHCLWFAYSSVLVTVVRFSAREGMCVSMLFVCCVLKMRVSWGLRRTSLPADKAQLHWERLGMVWAAQQVQRQPHKPGAHDHRG